MARTTDYTFFKALESGLEGDKAPLADLVSRLAFDERGLLPAIAQDVESGRVLMPAWMSQEALRATLNTGFMTYWSRSRQALWVKGATSGYYQRVVSIRFDCDGDALLCQVEQEGSACHTGRQSCFYLALAKGGEHVTISDLAT